MRENSTTIYISPYSKCLFYVTQIYENFELYPNNCSVLFHPQTSLASATSYESRCGPQVFAATGTYRNIVVRIKELKFHRAKNFSREVNSNSRVIIR